MAEQISNFAGHIPLADYFRLQVRILKLGALNSYLLNKLSQDYGVKAPIDKVVLCFLFVLSSYLPKLLATLLYRSFCKKETLRRFDSSTYTYSKAESIGEMSVILK